MSKSTGIDEVEMLRFFETEALEKVELLSRIIGAKVSARLREAGGTPEAPEAKRRRLRPEKEAGPERIVEFETKA